MAIIVNHEERRREILAKSLRLFAETGYTGVTFQRIAEGKHLPVHAATQYLLHHVLQREACVCESIAGAVIGVMPDWASRRNGWTRGRCRNWRGNMRRSDERGIGYWWRADWRRMTDERLVAARLLKDLTSLTGREIGRRLGLADGSGLANLLRLGDERLAGSRKLRRLCDKLK